MLPIATFPAYPNAAENASFIAIGFLLVMVMLAVLWWITELVGLRFKAAAASAKAAAPALAPEAVATALEDEDADNPHLPFLIAAAVDSAMQGQPHRIVNVRVAGDNWAREGRRDIFSGRRVR